MANSRTSFSGSCKPCLLSVTYPDHTIQMQSFALLQLLDFLKIVFSLVYVLFFHSTYCPVFVCLLQLGMMFYKGRKFSVLFSVLSLAPRIVPNTLALRLGA